MLFRCSGFHQRLRSATSAFPRQPLTLPRRAMCAAPQGATHLEKTEDEPRHSQEYSSAVVTYVVQETPSVKRLGLRVADDFKFRPGQWVDFLIPAIDSVGGFSIVSTPSMLPMMELAIRKASNPPAAWVHEACATGDAVALRSGGSFCLNAAAFTRPTVLVAGGMGINPIISMLLQHAEHVLSKRNDADAPPPPPVFLFYSCRTWAEAAYLPQLLRIWTLLPKRSFFLTVTFTQDAHLPDTIVQYSWEGVYGGWRAYTPLLLRGDDGGTPEPPTLELPETTKVYQVNEATGEKELMSSFDEAEGREMLAAGAASSGSGEMEEEEEEEGEEEGGIESSAAQGRNELLAAEEAPPPARFTDEEIEAMTLAELAAKAPEECDWSQLAWLSDLDASEPLSVLRKAQGRQILDNFFYGDISQEQLPEEDPLAYGDLMEQHDQAYGGDSQQGEELYRPSFNKMMQGTMLQRYQHHPGASTTGNVKELDGSTSVLPKNAADVLSAGFFNRAAGGPGFGVTLRRETLLFTSGRLSAKVIDEAVTAAELDKDSTDVWMCGPAPLLETLQDGLKEYEVKVETWE